MPMVFGQYGNQNFNAPPDSHYAQTGGMNIFDLQKQGWSYDAGSDKWLPPAGTGPVQNPFKGPYSGQMGTGAAGTGTAGAGSAGFSGSFQFGGKNPFATDAAAAKLRDEFARLRKGGKGALNEDLAARGIFSSGVGGRLASEQETQYGLAEAAALEDLFNRSAQQQMAFDLESQRMQRDAQMAAAGMGSQRFGSAGANDELLALYKMLGLETGGGGSQTFGGGKIGGGGTTGTTGTTATGGAGPTSNPTTGEPIRGKGESYNAWMSRWQQWFKNKQTAKKAAPTAQSMASTGMGFLGGLF